MESLRVDNISVRYKGSSRLAVRNASLSIAPGELVALTGDNGAGKSTLMRVMNGSLRPSSGKVVIGRTDVVVHPAHARRATATMPQSNTPIRGITPRQAVVNAALIGGISLANARKRADELFGALDMQAAADSAGEELSGGMRRLTNLAATLAQGTPIVLLDEPTNDVSPSRRPLLWKLLNALTEGGTTVFISTHNIDEAVRYSTRQIIMMRGEIVYSGTADRLLPKGRWSFIDIPSDTALPEDINSLVVERSPKIITLAVPEEKCALSQVDTLSRVLEQLKTVTQTVDIRQQRSFSSIFDSYLECSGANINAEEPAQLRREEAK